MCVCVCVYGCVGVCVRANPRPSQRIICMLTPLQRAASHCFFIVYFWKRSNVLLCWAHDSLLNTVESKINTASDLETQTQRNPVPGIRSTWAQLRPNLHVVFFSPEWEKTLGLSRISSTALLHSFPIVWKFPLMGDKTMNRFLHHRVAVEDSETTLIAYLTSSVAGHITSSSRISGHDRLDVMGYLKISIYCFFSW